MAEKTRIEWTDATWNPIRARRKDGSGRPGWACQRVSPACNNCYAEAMNRRFGTALGYTGPELQQVELYLDEKVLLEPLKWRRPRRVFVCSMTDLFGSFVADEARDRIFAVMALAKQHTFQVLTKRAREMREFVNRIEFERLRKWMNLAADGGEHRIGSYSLTSIAHRANWGTRWQFQRVTVSPIPHLQIGCTAEDQKCADERTPALCATLAAVRFLSVEPMLGPIKLNLAGIHWVVCGGESGPGARPMHPDWARGVRDQCVAAGVPFFFKQWGEWAPAEYVSQNGEPLLKISCDGKTECIVGSGADAVNMRRIGKKTAGRLLDGVEWSQFPEVLS